MSHVATTATPGPAFASFIITYRRPTILQNTIEALLAQSLPPDSILVVDNGAAGEAAEVVERFPESQVRYHAMPSNAGPAGAAAVGLQALLERGYDWVHWVDDDDPPKTRDTLERLMDLATSPEAPQPVGAVTAVGSRWDWQRGKHERPPDDALQGTVEVDVTSGNSHPIISRQAVEQAGLPNADLFFGLEEPEFALRLRRAGFKILVPGDLHRAYRRQAGRMNLERARRYVPQAAYDEIWRRYYSRRNYIHMMLRTFDRPDLAFWEAARTTAKAVLSWRRGWRFGQRYSWLAGRAIVEGVRGRLGDPVRPEPKA